MPLGEDTRIPGADGEFAAVWCSETIEHVLDGGRFPGEVRRVLRDSGILVLTMPYHGLVKNLLVAAFGFDRHFDPEGPHIRFFDRKGLARCLRKAGLEPMVWSGIGRMWPLYRTWFIVAQKQCAASQAT